MVLVIVIYLSILVVLNKPAQGKSSAPYGMKYREAGLLASFLELKQPLPGWERARGVQHDSHGLFDGLARAGNAI
jgi:hypothetical protein